MQSRFFVLIGVLLGLAVSAGILYFDRGGRPPPTGPLVSECDGSLRRLVIHYADEKDDMVIPVYQAFLRQLPADVHVYAVCPSEAIFQALVRQVGPVSCLLAPVLVGHPITSWSRDRRVARGGQTTTLLYPRQEDGAPIWPAREGDQRTAGDLAAALGPGVTARHSDLHFDGGDFAADSETVFVRPSIVLRNVQRTVQDRDQLVDILSNLFQRRVVILDGAPDHHVGMYMMPVGGRTVIVGDPRLAAALLAESDQESAVVNAFLPDGPNFGEAAIASFEAVAEHCRKAGYRVVRVPVVPGKDGRTFLTFVNGIQDEREGRRTVYMPTYSFAGSLNRAAAAVWTDLGYEVRPVECEACARYFGTLHCLVNVLERGER
jgi:hypothetical protein